MYLYLECPGCEIGSEAKTINCSYHCGFIASPNYPYIYPDNTQISWYLEVSEDNYIHMEFSNFHVESSSLECSQDYVDIYSGISESTRHLMGRYCEASPPPPVIRSGLNQMTIIFNSDGEYSNSGFIGHYTSKHYTLPHYIQQKLNRNGKILRYFIWCMWNIILYIV